MCLQGGDFRLTENWALHENDGRGSVIVDKIRICESFIEALNIIYEISGQWYCLNIVGYHRYNYCRTADIWKRVVTCNTVTL